MTDDIRRTYVILIWMFRETSVKMWQHSQKIKLIRPMCEKWEPKRSACIFPLYILRFPLYFLLFFIAFVVGLNKVGSSKKTFLRFRQTKFHFSKEISKYTKENIQVERFGSHFSHIGLINLNSWPGCYIFTDASLDTHINMTYVRHLSSLTSDIIDILQMSAMTDDGHKSYWYGCLEKRQ